MMLLTSVAHAQFTSASVMDNFASIYTNPHNTGNDILDILDFRFKVSVCSDLSYGSSKLIWEVDDYAGSSFFSGNTALAQGANAIYHADVCLVIDQGDGSIHAIAAWYYGGLSPSTTPSWYIEDYKWISTPTNAFVLQNNDFVNGTFGTTLNIDGDDKGNFILVYDEGGDIYALTGDMNFGFNMNNGAIPVPLTGIISPKGYFPDVSLYSDGSGSNQIVHLCYTYQSNLIVDDHDFNNIASGLSSPNNLLNLTPPHNLDISYPRIASPNSSGGKDDWTVVFQEDDRFTYYIEGVNSFGGSLSSVITYNDGTYVSSGNLTGVPNFNPVVAYDYRYPNDGIWVGWNMDASDGSIGGAFNAIYPIVIKCGGIGVPVSSAYWEVPKSIADGDDVSLLSLAGRNSNQLNSNDVFYLTYFNVDTKNDINTKEVLTTASSLRIAQPTATNNLRALFKNDLFSQNVAVTFKVIDLAGKTLYCQKGNINAVKNSIENLYLPSSIYIVQIRTDDGAYSLNQKVVSIK